MYNAKQKRKYIEHECQKKPSSEIPLTSIFNKLGDRLESYYGKDLCEFTYEELKTVLPRFEAKTYSYENFAKTTVSQYIDWCIKNGLSSNSENMFKMIESPSSKPNAYRNGFFKDQDHMLKWLEIALYSELEPSINTAYRVIICLLYLGLSVNEIAEIKDCDYDPSTHTIARNNGILTIPDEMFRIFDLYYDADTYEVLRSWGAVPFEKATTDRFIRLTTTEPITDNSVRLMLFRANIRYREETKSKFNVSTKAITFSGIFEKIYKKEVKTGNIDILPYIREKSVKLKYNSIDDVSEQIKKNAMAEYNDWKAAYYS